MTKLEKRYDFVLVFDVQDGNPNGDPDAGNMPRMDPETMQGLVTDVCLKRKLRNYVQLMKEDSEGYEIYVKEKAVLGRAHTEAFRKLGISLGEETRTSISEEDARALQEYDLPEGLTIEETGDVWELVVAGDADVKAIKAQLKEIKVPTKLASAMAPAFKATKARKPKAEETERGKQEMCRRFFDIRAFGAVMSLKSAPNCGQVRGPIQLTFARSVDPIASQEHSITRMAVATEKEAEEQHGDNRTMGRKNTIPYGLYVGHGFVSPKLAQQTGFSDEDLTLLWEALKQMFEHDRSAARGLMALRKLIVFKHASEMGNAPAHALFDLVHVKRKDPEKPARAFSDYEVSVGNPPAGVEAMQLV
jgi:CRISPR-associated protein Csd2